MTFGTVLLDLDGVVRHFDPTHGDAVEADHGLAAGSLVAAAFDGPLIGQVVTGRMTRAAWVDEVGRRVECPEAARIWLGTPATVDPVMVDHVDRLRARGLVVAILTNGTDEVTAELTDLGLIDHFDRVFNTAEIGVAKPDRRVYQEVCGALGVVPSTVFFTDDTPRNLPPAAQVGMEARLFEGSAVFGRHLTELGLAG